MGLNKSSGNMYEWISHMWSPITGCEHQCSYCYTRKYRTLSETPKLIFPFPNLGENRTIFVGHMCDMFASNVPHDWIMAILYYCRLFPNNRYVFQTKNPRSFFDLLLDEQCYLESLRRILPEKLIIGTTIETNRADLLATFSKAPSPQSRANAMAGLKSKTETDKLGDKVVDFGGDLGYIEKFVTVEPIMDFDVNELVDLLVLAKPTFVNIGADSKGHNLPEPTRAKVDLLVQAIMDKGIEIRKKVNLDRLQ